MFLLHCEFEFVLCSRIWGEKLSRHTQGKHKVEKQIIIIKTRLEMIFLFTLFSYSSTKRSFRQSFCVFPLEFSNQSGIFSPLTHSHYGKCEREASQSSGFFFFPTFPLRYLKSRRNIFPSQTNWSLFFYTARIAMMRTRSRKKFNYSTISTANTREAHKRGFVTCTSEAERKAGRKRVPRR